MNIMERAKKLVCDMNPAEAKRLNMLDGRSVQAWPEWAQRDFRLACDAMVAVNALKAELERENARLRSVVRAAYLHELDQMQMPDSGPLRLTKEHQRQLGRDLAELGPLPNIPVSNAGANKI